jgi:hypothetical protein
MKFDQYELLEQIAVGGMAEVFKGRVVAAEGFEKLVAINGILPDLGEDVRCVGISRTSAVPVNKLPSVNRAGRRFPGLRPLPGVLCWSAAVPPPPSAKVRSSTRSASTATAPGAQRARSS